MERPYPGVEFEAGVEKEGIIRLPEHVKAVLKPGMEVTVRILPAGIPRSLRAKGVSEEEIEGVAIRQLEQRDNVVRFLRAGGVLRGAAGFARRSSGLLNR